MSSPGDAKLIFWRLLKMLRPFWGRITIAIILLLLSSPCELFPAIVWKFVTDQIVLKYPADGWMMAWMMKWFSLNGAITGRFELLLSSAAWMLLVYLIGALLGTLDTWILNVVTQKFILGLRNTVYEKLQSQSLGYLQRQRTGDLMSRAISDVDELQSFTVNAIDSIVSDSILWLATVGIMLYLNWLVTVAALGPLVLVYALLKVFNKKVKPIYQAARERLGDVSHRLQENLSGLVVIKSFNREKQEAARFREATENYYHRQISAITARYLFFPATQAVGFLTNVSMLAVGGYQMIKGLFTPGDFLLFRAYWWRLFGPVQTLARVDDMIQRAVAAGRRVFEVLDAPDELPDRQDAIDLDETNGHMRLENVSFRYPIDPITPGNKLPLPPGEGRPAVSPVDRGEGRITETSPVVLHDVTLDIPSGKTVALCGPSGSGKSTVMNLLLRFYDPVEGCVTLDGHDLRAIKRESLRSHYGLVQQETFLFNETILDNIRYGHAEATMEQVIAAAKAANAHGFISAFPNGYETKVGERGVRLSGGQKQRISIARAFLANPPILLLDEPTSSVEPDSEATIIAALDRLMVGRTTILTSHRPSLIMTADYVYVIENGRVTQQGEPSELARNGGWFGRFSGAQEGEEVDSI